MNLRRKLLKEQRLYIIVNVTQAQKPSYAELKAVIGNGVDIVQLRCKDVSDHIFLRYAYLLRRLCDRFNAIFIINDRADIALASRSDGLHIGQDDIPPFMARKILGEDKIIGLSTHNMTQVKEAQAVKDIDYIGIGPIFKTKAKPDKRPIGLKIIRDLSRKKMSLPFFPIGGINLENINSLIKVGARRIALSSAVFNSKVPVKTIEIFKGILYDTY